jgi:hypothetical protein
LIIDKVNQVRLSHATRGLSASHLAGHQLVN